MRPVGPILVEIALGELVDKITILQIKNERIKDSGKLRNVRAELETLSRSLTEALASLDKSEHRDKELARLSKELKAANQTLWDVEDDIRDCERQKEFDAKFIALARSVYQTNDQRASLKRAINELFGSRLMEEKSYAAY